MSAGVINVSICSYSLMQPLYISLSLLSRRDQKASHAPERVSFSLALKLGCNRSCVSLKSSSFLMSPLSFWPEHTGKDSRLSSHCPRRKRGCQALSSGSFSRRITFGFPARLGGLSPRSFRMCAGARTQTRRLF